MKKFILIGFSFSRPADKPAHSSSQNHEVNAIPLKAGQWEFKPQTVEFLQYKSRPAMKLTSSSDPVILKNYRFTDGTIEYDMEPLDPRYLTTIHSDKVQDKMLRFGFSDEVWVIINDGPLFIDKNLYNTPMASMDPLNIFLSGIMIQR